MGSTQADLQCGNLLRHPQGGGEGGVKTVGVQPGEVLHLQVVEISIQMVHGHLLPILHICRS